MSKNPEKIVVIREDGPAPSFRGQLVAEASGDEVPIECASLYRTVGGKYVCERSYTTLRDSGYIHPVPIGEVKVVDTVEQVAAFLGTSPVARLLYARAKIKPPPEFIE